MEAPIRVLIADSHPVMRIGLRYVFEQKPSLALVGEAASGSEALRLTSATSPDVLVLEMKLPDPTGIEVARRVTPSTPVLVLSAYDDDTYVQELIDGTVSGYLLKRSRPEQIVEAVQGVARGEKGWLSPEITAKVMKLKRKQTLLEEHGISRRELEVLRLLWKGLDNHQIADKLSAAESTVKTHLTHIYEKLGTKTRAETIAWAYLNQVT